MKAFWIGAMAVAMALGPALSCSDDDSGTPDGGDATDGETTGGCTRTDECHPGYRCLEGTCTMVLPALDEFATDLSCVGSFTPVEPLPGTVTATVYLEDFQDDYRVEGATIDLFLDNVVDDSPDDTIGPTDENGEISGVTGLPARGRIAYRVHAGDLPGGVVRTTVEYDVEIPDADGGDVRFLSVSDSTYRLIPTILGITPDASHGIIAGEFGDCAADPDSVEGIVARLLNDEGEDCHELNDRECYSRYFVDEFPSRIDNQAYSSADGLYAIAQVAPGEWNLEVLGRLTAATTEYPFDLLGHKTVNCIADSIVIVDVFPLEASAP